MIMRTVELTLLAAVIAFALDMGIGVAAPPLTAVPRDFPPFTFLPILSGTVGGTILASLVYSILRASVAVPDRAFLFLTLAVFTLSLALPLRLSFTRSPRFAGVTPAAQMALVLMHAVVATVSLIALTSQTARR